MLFLS
ncbi:unnamed protein product, partial [Lathyrus oleraceus]